MNPPGFTLIESLLFEDGYHRLERHLARLERSAAELGFSLRPGAALAALQEQAQALGSGPHKVRLQLGADGSITCSADPLSGPADELAVILAGDRIDSQWRMVGHKTSNRALFNRCSAAATRIGAHDVLFLNERDELAEAANSNVFLKFGDELLTPPLSAGVLPGVYRQQVLESEAARAREARLLAADLHACDSIHLCNSVRGWRTVKLLSGTLGIQGGSNAT